MVIESAVKIRNRTSCGSTLSRVSATNASRGESLPPPTGQSQNRVGFGGPARGKSSIEIHASEPRRPGTFPGESDDLRAAIDPDDRSGWADQLRGEHRDVAGAAAQVEHPHALADPRAPQAALGDRPQDGRPVHQPPDLSPQMAEDGLRPRHVARTISHVAPAWSSTPFAA